MAHSFWTTQCITFFSAFALVSAFGLLSLRTLHLCIRAYAAQSLSISFAALLLGSNLGHKHILAVAVLALGVKGFLIPWFLGRMMKEVAIKRETDPLVNAPVSMLLGVGLALLSYAVMGRVITLDIFAARAFSLSLTLMLLGLWLMIGRKKAMTQVIGLLVVENGLFVAALATSFGMPMIVELGLVFDLLVATVIMGLLIFRIQRTFASINTDRLSRLRG